ncbi:hypothetical protein CLV52_3133 [Amnibacterium kyonggiense]|uniref:Uncharacterized protein n=1 Tax=Amnibacterium kyonggiense TaxID=595671 RepID=A0A4V3EAK1_9MICO|nr:hypothetical protein CLV52_3133 [Amnibacterium kyonggiense]
MLQALFAQTGAGVYTRNDVAETVGWVVIAVNVVGLVLAIALSVPRLRDHRMAFFVPITIGVACLLLTVGLTLGAALADPSFTAKLTRG